MSWRIMIGEGDQKVAWQQLAQELGVADRLRWVGNVPKDKISVYYNACNVLVNPAVRKPIDGPQCLCPRRHELWQARRRLPCGWESTGHC